jgi:DNA polymerase III epsilon subunit-like protein
LSKTDTVLIIDVATNATTPRCNAQPHDFNAWPRLVSLSWSFYSATGEKLRNENYVIKPRDFTIPAETTRFHGVTMHRAQKRGIPVRLVLRRFANEILNRQPRLVVAHNIEPDIATLHAEYMRQGLPLPFEGIPTFCTMERTTDLCRLPGRYDGFKWPALGELQLFLFREPLVNCCTTNEKVRALAKIFFELQQLPVEGPWKCIFEKKIL